MENKFLKNPVYQNKDGYNSHDMSQRVGFSSALGQLLPIYYDFLNPGDKITINSHLETRTLTLDSAVWGTLKDQVDYFFIPIEQIYSLFGSMFYGIDDRKSSFVLSQNDISQLLPACDLKSLVAYFDQDYSSVRDEMNYPRKLGFYRLCDAFGISSAGLEQMTIIDPQTYVHPLSLLWFAAYQKCYYDFYRLDEWENNEPLAFSLDRFYNRRSLIDTFDTNFVKLFHLHYRPFGKDFYKNVFPTPLIPAGSQQSSAGQSLINSNYMGAVNQWLSSQDSFKSVGIGDQGTPSNGANTVSVAASVQNVANTVNAGQINTANLRSMFALDKLLEVTRRAGKSYDLQTLAHYGVKVDDFNKDKVFYLGSHENEIVSQAVVSTADTPESNTLVGDISGKGFGSTRSSNPIRFTAQKHGILLAIYSCVPSLMYAQMGVDKLMTIVERTDLPIQEFQNLGMQPLFDFQVDLWDNNNTSPTDWSDFKVWQYRYAEFKQKINRVFGSLMFTERRWMPQVRLNTNNFNTLSNRLIRPNFLNGIVSVNFSLALPEPSEGGSEDYTPSTSANYGKAYISQMYATDPLQHNFVFDVAKASKLSNYGLPNL